MNNLLETFIDRYGYLLDLCGKSDWDFEDIENYVVSVGYDKAPRDLMDRWVDDMTDEEIIAFRRKLRPDDKLLLSSLFPGVLKKIKKEGKTSG